MFSKNKLTSKGSFLKPDFFSCLLPALAAVIFIFTATTVFSQDQPILAPTQPAVKLSSAEFIGQDGLTIDRLIETGAAGRGDLLAARQRLAIAQGRLIQARLRPNPTLDTEYGSPRFLGGEAESNFSVGATCERTELCRLFVIGQVCLQAGRSAAGAFKSDKSKKRETSVFIGAK